MAAATIQDQSAALANLTSAVNALLGDNAAKAQRIAELEAQIAAPPTVSVLTATDASELTDDVDATNALAAQVESVLTPPTPPAAPADAAPAPVDAPVEDETPAEDASEPAEEVAA